MAIATQETKTKLNPFRPGSGLFPACLAGRKLDIDHFSSRLYSTITGTPKNFLLYGDSKMGKTSLLTRMERMAEEKKLLTVSTLGSATDLSELTSTLSIRLFMQLKEVTTVDLDRVELLLESFKTLNKGSRQALEMAFSDFLIKVWDLVRDEVPAFMITVDDLDFVREPDQALLLLQNVTKNIFRRDCPLIFVLTCSKSFFDTVEKKNKDLIHYFDLIHVGRLQRTSLLNAIRVPLWELHLPFDEDVVHEIARRSDGYPYYLQTIAHFVFEEAKEKEFDALALRRGYMKALQALERTIFLPIANSITPTEVKIFIFLFEAGEMTFTNLNKDIKMPRGSVASSLKRLKEKQLIRQRDKKYEVCDRLFAAYLLKKVKEAVV